MAHRPEAELPGRFPIGVDIDKHEVTSHVTKFSVARPKLLFPHLSLALCVPPKLCNSLHISWRSSYQSDIPLTTSCVEFHGFKMQQNTSVLLHRWLEPHLASGRTSRPGHTSASEVLYAQGAQPAGSSGIVCFFCGHRKISPSSSQTTLRRRYPYFVN